MFAEMYETICRYKNEISGEDFLERVKVISPFVKTTEEK